MADEQNADASNEHTKDADPEAREAPKGGAKRRAEPGQKTRATLPVLINSIATQVFVSLGVVENPLTGERTKDLDSARFSIDLLSVLSEKTQGNLSEMEKRYLEGVLYELRMRFVAAAEGKDQPEDEAPEPEAEAPEPEQEAHESEAEAPEPEAETLAPEPDEPEPTGS